MDNNGSTPKQERLMRSLIEEWIEVPFDTSPVNKEKAEAAINLTYESVEEDRPKEIIWFDNPVDAVVWIVNKDDEHYGSIISNRIEWEDGLVDNIERNIPSSICTTFNNSFNRFIHRKYFWWASDYFLANLVDYHIAEHFKNKRGKAKYSEKWTNLHSIAQRQTIGMHDIYDLAAAAFYHKIGYDRSEFRGYWQAAKHCGLWWAFYNVAVVIPKPSIIHLDEESRLHAEDKPALVYKGFELYAHRGKYIDSKIIT